MTDHGDSTGIPPDTSGGHLGTPEQEGRRVARATGLLGGLTAASRLLGLARDMGQAALLGTGMAADAFTLAFIIPNILRRLFGEGTVSAALVPTYTEALVSDTREQTALLGNRITTFVASALILIVVVGIVTAPLLVGLFAPGFSEVPGKAGLTTGLLRLLFPYILFVGTGTVLMGILNSHRHFLSPALAPIFFNISALAGIFLLSKILVPGIPVWGYAAGVTVGGFLQLLVQVPALRNRGFRFRPDFNWRDSRFLRILRLAVPALIGLIAGEVNVLVDQMIASLLQPGSVAALSYGLRVTQVPQGIFAIALATALLPTLSRQTVLGRLDEAGRTLSRATLALTALMIPSTLCMVFLAEPIVRVVLARGAFTETSVGLTTAALLFYSLGLVFYSGVRITAPVFYAMKDTRTPVKIAVTCMGLNIVLNVVFTWIFLQTGIFIPLAGLALASSIASMVHLWMLRHTLRKRLGRSGKRDTRAWLAVLPASAASAGVLALLSRWAGRMAGSGFLRGAGAVAGVSLLALGVFFLLFHWAGGQGARSMFRMVLRRGS
jgi:putative peptidoglycan lipid II flippase